MKVQIVKCSASNSWYKYMINSIWYVQPNATTYTIIGDMDYNNFSILISDCIVLESSNTIDLSKNQIIEPAIQAWLSYDNKTWIESYLFSIDHRTEEPYKTEITGFPFCSLTKPIKPKSKNNEFKKLQNQYNELLSKYNQLCK